MKSFNKLYILFIVLVLFASCTSYKDITFLRNLDPKTTDSLIITKSNSYKIQPADILYIKVNCMDANINEVFNKSSLTSNMMSYNLGGFYVIGYTVESDGTISLPVLGRIFISGSTIAEASAAIQKQADKYISNAQVELKLVSFKISVLGEVKKPGQYNIYNDKANIFEALALAGDLTYYANRKTVLILRSDIKGTKTYRINLTKKDILASDLYYLQPNDIVYIEPLKSAGLRQSASDYSTLITAISATLTTIILIRTLNK
jgi:polysaccharide biosynthesis/export protein